MKFNVTTNNLDETNADVWVLAVHEEDLKGSAVKHFDDVTAGMISAAIKEKEFTGELDSHCLLHGLLGKKMQRILLWGFGKKESHSLNSLRSSLAKIARFVRCKNLSTYALNLHCDNDATWDDCVEAHVTMPLFGLYKFDKYFSKKSKKQVTQCTLCCEKKDLAKAKALVARAQHVGEAANEIRNLVNEPANVVDAKALAAYAQKISKKNKMKCTVLKEPQLKKLGMRALLGVNQGSDNEPRVAIMEWGAKYKKNGTVCVVGKGVTFDAGGISIKPSPKMGDMKMDMGGAGATLGILDAVSRLKLPVHVVGVIGCVENMCSGSAQRPGDVVKTMSGKTVEIDNTDAEGRLVLADCIHYATTKYKPKAVINLCTLTGGVIVALGSHHIGMCTNDDELLSKIKDAGARSGETVWHMPSGDEYQADIRSEIADVRNMGRSREASCTAGAMFVKQFINDTPWIHLDIAGTAWTDGRYGNSAKGATGVGVRLVTKLLENWN